MKLASPLAACVFSCAASLAWAEGADAKAAEAPSWDFAATGYWNAPRGGDSYASGIFTANRDALHLEARANYEAVHAQSAFVGWTFGFGSEDSARFEITPIVGGVRGAIQGAIGGFEASVAAGRFDFYVEAEYVRDESDKEASYKYAWSELGFKPTEWSRLGLVGQRTRIYGGEREFQRGGFVQVMHEKLTFAVYWFNPGSSDQVVIGSVGVAF